jgi:hypothetical protein
LFARHPISKLKCLSDWDGGQTVIGITSKRGLCLGYFTNKQNGVTALLLKMSFQKNLNLSRKEPKAKKCHRRFSITNESKDQQINNFRQQHQPLSKSGGTQTNPKGHFTRTGGS